MEEDKFDATLPGTEIEQTYIMHKYITEDQDRLEIGTPGKMGALKISGDFTKPEEFKKKIDDAIELRKYANAKLDGFEL